VISKELNFSDFSLARISSIVLWTIFSSSIPKTVAALISLARQQKVHPTSRISRSNPHLSRSLTNPQPGTLHSLSNSTASGKSVRSLIRMVPVLIVSDIWGLLSVHSGALFCSNWH